MATIFFDGDIGAVLTFNIKTPTGSAYVITGGTITLLVEGLDDFACSISDGPGGVATLTISAGTFPTGTYRAQVKTEVGGVTLHTPAFPIQVGHVVDIGTGVVITPPSGNPTEGAIPFGNTGGGTYTEDPANLFFDDTKNSLKLFGGALGTNAVKVLTLGSGTAPTTSPADTVQLWVTDLNGATTAGLRLRDETGHVHQFGRTFAVQMGDHATKVAVVGGVVDYLNSSVGTPANTTETVLHTLTIPVAGLTVDGQALRFFFQGTLAANGNNKTVRAKVNGLGGTLIVDSGTITTNNADYKVEGALIRTSSTTAAAQGVLFVGPAGLGSGAVSVHRFGAASISAGSLYSSPVTIDLTGQNGSASANDIRCIYSKSFLENF